MKVNYILINYLILNYLIITMYLFLENPPDHNNLISHTINIRNSLNNWLQDPQEDTFIIIEEQWEIHRKEIYSSITSYLQLKRIMLI
jgi:hypothetical protein